MNKAISGIGLLRQLFAESTPVFKLALLLVFMGMSFLILSFFAMILAMPLFSLGMADIQKLMATGFADADIAILRYFTAFQTVGLFCVPALLTNGLFFSEKDDFLKSQHINYMLAFFLVGLTVLVYAPTIQLLIHWNSLLKFPESMLGFEQRLQTMELEHGELGLRLVQGNTIGTLLINWLIAAILPALSEEFLFRGVLQTLFQKWFKNAYMAILLAAIIFSAIHMQFYGFLPRLLLGIFFGFLFYWTKNIWVPILAHLINNTLAIWIANANPEEWNFAQHWFREIGSGSNIRIFLSLGLTLALVIVTRRFLRSGLSPD